MSNALTPEKLVQRILDKVETDHDTTRDLIQELFTVITEQLKVSDRMALYGFGTFKKTFVEESTGRNPQTGEPLTIPSHFRVKFSPASALAVRINSEYSNLQPVILDDEILKDEEEEHEGLLIKAMKYELDYQKKSSGEAAMTQPHTMVHGTSVIAPVEEGTQPALTVVSREQDEETRALADAVSSTSQKESRKGIYYTAGALLAIVLLLGGIYWGTRGTSSETEAPVEVRTVVQQTESVSEERAEPPVDTAREEAPPERAAPAEESEPPVSAAAEPVEPENPAVAVQSQTAAPLPSEPYSISSGDSFSVIARDMWGNIHLWPYLYRTNRESYPDPDFLHPGDSILIPPRPDISGQAEEIESSIMMAYRRYRTLIEEQQSSSRNANRAISSHYVLAGGETLYPSFLERYKNRIRPEDIQRVEEILKR